MLKTSIITLERLAAVVWYTGVVVLIIKSTGLLLEADKGGVSLFGIVVAVFSGVMIGWMKAKYLFVKACERNLNRINGLKNPMIWQFYRIRFFFFLFLMMSGGNTLSKMAKGNNLMLLLLAVLELSIAIALLISSQCFWQKQKT